MTFLIKAAQLILSLSIIVSLHELGHFLAAKYFKTRVEKFYLFFNPWFSIWKKQIGETEYGLGWLPLGGYVKIAGMVDESMDTEQMSKPPEPWEFRAKPPWQRLIIITAGVIVNLILGMFIYAMIMFTWGSEKLPVENASYGYPVDSVLIDLGFQNGDIPLAFGNERPEYASDLASSLLLSDDVDTDVEVIRNGKDVHFMLKKGWRDVILESNTKSLFVPLVPFVADTILSSGTAINSDLKKDDRIIGINDISTPWFSSFRNEIGEFKGKEISLHVI